jgi:hypothetical protein
VAAVIDVDIHKCLDCRFTFGTNPKVKAKVAFCPFCRSKRISLRVGGCRDIERYAIEIEDDLRIEGETVRTVQMKDWDGA